MHTVGIDRAVNAGFLGRLAGLGAGRCELVESEDRLDAAMEHIHRRIGAPLVTDLSLKADGMDLGHGHRTCGSHLPRRPAASCTGVTGDGSSGLTVHGLAAAARLGASGRGTVVPTTRPPAPSGPARICASWRTGTPWASTAGAARSSTSRWSTACCAGSPPSWRSTPGQVAEGGPAHRVIQPVEPPSGWEMPTAMPLMAAGAPMMAKMATFTTTGLQTPPGSAADRPVAAAPPPGAAPAPPFAAAPAPAPRRASRGFSIGRFLPHTGEGTAPVTDFDSIRPLLAEELTKLGQAESLPERERRRYLADLASRLRVVDQMVGGHPDLTVLAADLERAEWAEVSLDELWQRTTDLLTALTGGSASAGSTSPASPGSTSPSSTSPGSASGAEKGRVAFWKRS